MHVQYAPARLCTRAPAVLVASMDCKFQYRCLSLGILSLPLFSNVWIHPCLKCSLISTCFGSIVTRYHHEMRSCIRCLPVEQVGEDVTKLKHSGSVYLQVPPRPAFVVRWDIDVQYLFVYTSVVNQLVLCWHDGFLHTGVPSARHLNGGGSNNGGGITVTTAAACP